MRVVLAAVGDSANVSKTLEKALRRVGVDALAVKSQDHPFNYPEQAVIYDDSVAGFVESADLYHVLNSKPPPWLPKRDVPVVVQHGGSHYRCYKDIMHDMLSEFRVVMSLIETPDLLGLSSKPEIFFSTPIDTSIYPKPERRPRGRLRVGHFPTNPASKGTAEISRVAREIDGIEYVTRGVKGWSEHIKDLLLCDVVIETLCMMFTHKGITKPLGESGLTAKEASLLGAIVVTNCVNPDPWGERPLLIANDEDALRDQIEFLVGQPGSEIDKMSDESRAWALADNDLEHTGLWLKRLYEQYA